MQHRTCTPPHGHSHTPFSFVIQLLTERPFIELFLGLPVCSCVSSVCNPLFQPSMCASAGLRPESRCNFPHTKTSTSGTRGERNILQVQTALLSWTTESYRLAWPVARHRACVYVCVCMCVCWGSLEGVRAALLHFFHSVKPLLGSGPVLGAAGQYFTCSSWEMNMCVCVCVGVCLQYNF